MRQDDFKAWLDVCFRGRAKAPSKCMISSSDVRFFVDDDKVLGYCGIVLPNPQLDSTKMFEVNNPDSKKVELWRIDGCFFRKSSPQRCDCVLFDDTYFCFVEFKTNAESLLLKTIKANRIKAIMQLEKTIQLVDTKLAEEGLDYMGYVKEAYLCTPVTYPNKGTAIRSEQIRFLTTYDTKLFEKNGKEF